jgi:hypothetical protein
MFPSIPFIGKIGSAAKSLWKFVKSFFATAKNIQVEKQNEEMQEKLKLRIKMTFKEPFFYQEGDKTPFCPSCWESKDTAVHLVFLANRRDAIVWDCPTRKTRYPVQKDRSIDEPKRFRLR